MDINECRRFADKVIEQGLAVSLTHHFENFKYLNLIYHYYKENPLSDFRETENMKYLLVGDSKSLSNRLNIARLEQVNELGNPHILPLLIV